MKKGFTTIEIITAIIFLLIIFGVFTSQKNQIQQKMRDQQRKTAVNAIYFNLKEVYFKKHGYYPEFLTPDSLEGVDPAIFTDPNKILLGDQGSNYEYSTSNCDNNRCQNFTISSQMELEASYSKSSK